MVEVKANVYFDCSDVTERVGVMEVAEMDKEPAVMKFMIWVVFWSTIEEMTELFKREYIEKAVVGSVVGGFLIPDILNTTVWLAESPEANKLLKRMLLSIEFAVQRRVPSMFELAGVIVHEVPTTDLEGNLI